MKTTGILNAEYSILHNIREGRHSAFTLWASNFAKITRNLPGDGGDQQNEAHMRTLSRRVWSLLGFAMLLAVVLLYLNSRRPSARVAVVQASRQTLSSSISSNGKVEPIVPYSLRAKFDGFVDRVIAIRGQEREEGRPPGDVGRPRCSRATRSSARAIGQSAGRSAGGRKPEAVRTRRRSWPPMCVQRKRNVTSCSDNRKP